MSNEWLKEYGIKVNPDPIVVNYRFGAVYFALNQAQNLIKIGMVHDYNNVTTRISSLRTMMKEDICLIGYFKIDESKVCMLERALHEKFERDKIKYKGYNEWFEADVVFEYLIRYYDKLSFIDPNSFRQLCMVIDVFGIYSVLGPTYKMWYKVRDYKYGYITV